jgi:hypothetical protein
MDGMRAARVALTLSGSLPGPLLTPAARLLFRGGLDSRLKGLFLGGIVDVLNVRLLLRYVPSLRRGVVIVGEVVAEARTGSMRRHRRKVRFAATLEPQTQNKHLQAKIDGKRKVKLLFMWRKKGGIRF